MVGTNQGLAEVLGLTKVSQAAAGRNLWIDPRKHPIKYPKYHVRQ